MHWQNYATISVICYLIGGFPTGVVLSKRSYGLDVRDMGSGNIGATNITRVFGWYAGVLVFVIDFLKGFLPLWILKRFIIFDSWGLAFAGFFLVVGHCFSPYLRLKGGKGVATSLGCLSLVFPLGALIGAATYAVLLAFTRISAIGSLGGILGILVTMAVVRPETSILVLVICVSIIVVIRHHENIRRLIKGS